MQITLLLSLSWNRFADRVVPRAALPLLSCWETGFLRHLRGGPLGAMFFLPTTGFRGEASFAGRTIRYIRIYDRIFIYLEMASRVGKQ